MREYEEVTPQKEHAEEAGGVIGGKPTPGRKGGFKETEDVQMAENCRQGFLFSVLSEFREGEKVEE